MRAEVRSPHDRRPARAPLDLRRGAGDGLGGEKRVELPDPLLEREHLGAAASKKGLAEAVAAHHLEREPTDVADLDLAQTQELPPLTSHGSETAGTWSELRGVRDTDLVHRPRCRRCAVAYAARPREQREETRRHLQAESTRPVGPISAARRGRKLPVGASDPGTKLGSRAMEIERVGVVGLGTMGAGIAQVCVQARVPTVGVEVSSELGERARARLDHFLSRAVEKGRLSDEEKKAALARLETTTAVGDLADCDLVIEAIVEELDAKRTLFRELDRIVAPETILATNTSALPVTEIAAAVERPERVVGLHFFNPAPVLALVEVVRTELTSDPVFAAAYAFAERLGKEPIACNDTPGFVVNRILIPLLNDCVRVIDEAGVSPEEVDRAMRFGTNWPIGPCALIDLIGVDVHVHASEALWEALREPRMAPPPRLVRMEQAGLLGRKTGRGFFTYDDSHR